MVTVAGQAAKMAGESAAAQALASGASGYYDRGVYKLLPSTPTYHEKNVVAALSRGGEEAAMVLRAFKPTVYKHGEKRGKAPRENFTAVQQKRIMEVLHGTINPVKGYAANSSQISYEGKKYIAKSRSRSRRRIKKSRRRSR